MMVFVGGCHFDLGTLKGVGHSAVAIVLLGSGLPVLFTWAVFRWLGWAHLAGIASGISLSSTAIGITTKQLADSGMLRSKTGVLLQGAAMLDDIVGLVLLGILKQLGGDQHKSLVWIVLQPVLVSIGLAIVAVGFEAVFPRLEARLGNLPCLQPYIYKLRVGLLFALLAGSTAAAEFAGSSYLFGSFLAGVSVSKCHVWVEAFEDSVRDFCAWFPRLFFGATGLGIPIGTLFEREAFTKGLLVTAFSKWVSGLAVVRPLPLVNIIGCGMIGRGDIGFVLISDSRAAGIVTDVQHGATVWALIICTVVSPPLFGLALKARAKEHNETSERGNTIEPEVGGLGDSNESSTDSNTDSLSY